ATSSDKAYHWGQANGEGLTPTFWQTNANSMGAVAWPRFPDKTGPLVYSPSQLLTTVFTIPSSYGLGSTTLLQGLGLSGGGPNGLMQAAVAALLNATPPRVAYPLTAPQVIAQVNAALASGSSSTISSLKSTLAGYNSLGSDLDQNGNTSGPQRAAVVPTGPAVGVSPLTEEALAPIVAEALARWTALGARLSAADFRVAGVDLPDGDAGQGPLIGYTSGTTVQLDVNAGGLGWFVDPTPGDDSEFAGTGDVYALRADGGPAAGQMDLLTVVMHELGHVLGLEDR